MQAGRSLTEVNDALKHLMLQDLRIQCRARGISPAGARGTLLERLAEHMMNTEDLCVLSPQWCCAPTSCVPYQIHFQHSNFVVTSRVSHFEG